MWLYMLIPSACPGLRPFYGTKMRNGLQNEAGFKCPSHGLHQPAFHREARRRRVCSETTSFLEQPHLKTKLPDSGRCEWIWRRSLQGWYELMQNKLSGMLWQISCTQNDSPQQNSLQVQDLQQSSKVKRISDEIDIRMWPNKSDLIVLTMMLTSVWWLLTIRYFSVFGCKPVLISVFLVGKQRAERQKWVIFSAEGFSGQQTTYLKDWVDLRAH